MRTRGSTSAGEKNTEPRLRIPIVIGHNRLRGKSQGAMVDETPGEGPLQVLRCVLAQEARKAGVEPTDEWIRRATRQMLDLYEEAQAEWSRSENHQDTVGCVFEARMPTGQCVLLGTRELLARIPENRPQTPSCQMQEEDADCLKGREDTDLAGPKP